MLGQHRCIVYASTPLITEQIGAFLSVHFRQPGRQRCSADSTEGSLPLVPASVPEPGSLFEREKVVLCSTPLPGGPRIVI